MVALLGRRDEPTDGVRDYCSLLAEALRRRGVTLKLAESFWERDGWLRELWNLWKQSRKWRGEWVLMEYTALAWSRRGFPFGVLAVLALLDRKSTRLNSSHQIISYAVFCLKKKNKLFITNISINEVA